MGRNVSFGRHGKDWQADRKHAKDHELTFDKGSEDSITFYIGTPAGRFTFNEEDPIWVKIDDDGECPKKPCSHPDIRVESCHGPRLVVHNANQEKARLRYQLNVYDREEKEWCPIDPIMNNGGKGLS